MAFDVPQADRDEALALCDENLMDRMLDAGQLTDADIIPAVARRHVFPCWFGSALRRTENDALESVDALLDGIDRYTRPAPALDAFGAKVFKVSQDEQGTRLTWLRVTGGELKVKAQLSGEADGEPWEEKANQLRLYSGVKYTLAEAISPGQVCAVTGLTKARPGEGLGAERDSDVPVLEPVLSYQVLLPEGLMCTRHWASCTGWKKRSRSSMWYGTRLWARSMCSSWARCSWKCCAVCWQSALA